MMIKIKTIKYFNQELPLVSGNSFNNHYEELYRLYSKPSFLLSSLFLKSYSNSLIRFLFIKPFTIAGSVMKRRFSSTTK